MKDILEKDVRLHLRNNIIKTIKTKERALELANFRCAVCDNTPVESCLTWSFGETTPHDCEIMCVKCHHELERVTQLKKYLEFVKEKSKYYNEELNRINIYVSSNCHKDLSPEDIMEIITDLKERKRFGLDF